VLLLALVFVRTGALSSGSSCTTSAFASIFVGGFLPRGPLGRRWPFTSSPAPGHENELQRNKIQQWI
jgi:hypothetical protein